MDYRALFKGEYIAAVELGAKQPTMTISGIKLCKLEQEDGRQKDKGIISFREIDRGWVLNRTNAQCLAAMFGNETDNWIGKRVTLYSTPVRVGPKTEPGIRVKGSPDIAETITIMVTLPRKKPAKTTLIPTGKTQPKAQPAEDQEPDEPEPPIPEDESVAA